MERCEAGLKYRIVGGCGQEYADAPHPLALLRARRVRPSCRELVRSMKALARND
jgi:hypothetical protein